MKDIRIVSARHLLKVHSIAPIRGFLPPSIVVLGYELDKASEVFYNEIQTTEFIIQSSSRLVVRIPEPAVGKDFTSIKVLSSVQASKKNAEISFKLNNPLQSVSGIDRLIQSWLLVFLTTPGSDVFDKQSGGGAQSLIGKTTDRSGKGVSADLALAIERTNSQIIKKQSVAKSVPLSEKLLSSSLDQIVFDSTTGTLSARVSIQNMVGEQAELSVR